MVIFFLLSRIDLFSPLCFGLLSIANTRRLVNVRFIDLVISIEKNVSVEWFCCVLEVKFRVVSFVGSHFFGLYFNLFLICV